MLSSECQAWCPLTLRSDDFRHSLKRAVLLPLSLHPSALQRPGKRKPARHHTSVRTFSPVAVFSFFSSLSSSLLGPSLPSVTSVATTGCRLAGGALAALPPRRGRHGRSLRDRGHQRPRARLGVADDPHGPPPGAPGRQPLVALGLGSGRCERSSRGDQASQSMPLLQQ